MYNSIYVDHAHTLRVVVPVAEKEGIHEWNVYCAGRDAPGDMYTSEGWVEKVFYTELDDSVILHTCDESVIRGQVVQGDEEFGNSPVSWENGDEWTPLVVSYLQRRILNYRTYVPTTYLLFVILCNTASAMRSSVAYYVGGKGVWGSWFRRKSVIA